MSELPAPPLALVQQRVRFLDAMDDERRLVQQEGEDSARQLAEARERMRQAAEEIAADPYMTTAANRFAAWKAVRDAAEKARAQRAPA